jgi:hypothetical protein
MGNSVPNLLAGINTGRLICVLVPASADLTERIDHPPSDRPRRAR